MVGSLSFNTWTHEPIAQFFVQRLRLTPLGMSAFGILLVALVHTFALGGFAIWDASDAQESSRLSRFAEWQFGEWAVVAAFWVALPILVGFYPWIIRASGVIYANLWDDDVIIGSQAELKKIVIDDDSSLAAMTNDVRWTYLAAAVAVVGEALVFRQGLSRLWVLTPGIGKDIWLFYAIAAPLNMLGLYILTIVVCRYIATIHGLNSVFSRASGLSINVRPWYPDRVGGLRSLATYAVRVSWFMAAAGAVLLLFVYNSSVLRAREAVDGSLLDGIKSSVLGAGAAVDGSLLDGIKSALDTSPALWLAIALYVILSPLIFFLTVGSAHVAMREAKDEQLRLLSDRLDSEYQLAGRPAGRSATSTPVTDLVKLHDLTQSFPIWPFDITTIRRFGAAMSAPFLAIGVPISFEILARLGS